MTERADAARNRRAILDAAERLYEERGLDAVSMDAVAAAAGVGKGTLFRRFGDRRGLVRAVMERRSAALRQAVESGPPPLGPGAPPADRLVAFLDRAAALVCRSNARSMSYDLCGDPRGAECALDYWHGHVADLVAAARPDADAPVLAHSLLATVDGRLVHLMMSRGIGAARIRATAVALARAAVAAPPP